MVLFNVLIWLFSYICILSMTLFFNEFLRCVFYLIDFKLVRGDVNSLYDLAILV